MKIYYGAETKKALENFPISGLKPHPTYISSIVNIKKAAAKVNNNLKILEDKKALAIIKTCDEILSGKFADQFVVDPYQAGAGTSHNMNINEVIANRAGEISRQIIHPNDHVNMSQSTNDVIPAAIRITCLFLLPSLLKSLKLLKSSFDKKSKQFSRIIKPGRTHLQDALPITLGQEFTAYSKAIKIDMERINQAAGNLFKIGIGGTGVGTGINTHPDYHKMMVKELKNLTKFPLKSSGNLIESMQNTADFLHLSSMLRILAQSLIRIGNDLRLLSSGPSTGLAEIILPEVQKGSSIMPGKVNPSIIEMMTMVCFQVIGFDQAILQASIAGQLELNVMLPLIAFNLIEQIRLLTNTVEVLNKKCIADIAVDKKMCRYWFERSSGIAAILNPFLGYDKITGIVKYALKYNLSIREVIINRGYLDKKTVDKIFHPRNLTRPNIY
ncbi:hypothetical protein A3D03_01525 [Candidatus Gottesmanbacteria bacterium RIFCSPHIGHO2_02_FULL_40_13]|uniref:Aspartate ammonia-lyase n=1 Tax=Candidatus Gottesmanbacteria bacterium RIFCSPHIGHO2_02_FULL_40_13 TaxID=1798384 RepID=A0A1F6ABG2_9BACT|nr:MAG: hypothetical protein A3D03_01525 [Candidatus Gottesmanbacteria bacterium RIFCSPHIGHO2_02_FULL_40_13]